MRSVRSAAILLAASLLCAPPLAADPSAEPWREPMPVRDPWLRESLPGDVLIYVRTPDLFGFLATPKGSVLDGALRSRANVENIERIRQGFVANVLDIVPAYAEPVARQVQEHLRSPVELAVFMTPVPSAMVAMTIDADSDEAFASILFAAGFDGVARGLVGPLDDRGVGEIFGMPVPMFVQFDAATGRLLVHSGPAATAESFDALLSKLQSAGAHRMRAMESRVDESGQGIFAWIDAQQALPAMRLTMQPENYADIADSGLESVSSAAFGWGVANGKGRLAFVADLIEGRDRGYLPFVENDISLRSVGEPDALFVLTLPSTAEFSRLETRVLESADPIAQADWLDAKDEFQRAAGFSIEALFDAIGPEIVAIFDGAGDYMAVALRDARLWDRIVEGLSELPNVDVESRRIDGDTYYHMRVFDNAPPVLEEGMPPWLSMITSRQQDHIYWTRDRDYLYVASVPQVLIDRNALRPRTEVADWLAERQRVDLSNAVFSIMGTSRKLPRRYYGVYLEILELFGDISGAEVDLWSMPTAEQLGLPESGTIAMTLSFGDPTIALEMTFENNPGELLGGIGGVALVGVMAAIAIPAYADYTTRAQISEGLALAAANKVAVAEFYQDNGRFPNAAEADALSNYDTGGQYAISIFLEPDTGVLIVTYVDEVASGGGQLYLTPEATGTGSISWGCYGTFANKHLPAACRD